MFTSQRAFRESPSTSHALHRDYHGSIVDASGAVRRSARLKSAASTMMPKGRHTSAVNTTPQRSTTLDRTQSLYSSALSLPSTSGSTIRSSGSTVSAYSVPTSSSSLRQNLISTASVADAVARSSSWSAKDDEILIQARAQGLNWNQIAPKHFPFKSPNACRKRHERLMERQNAEQWNGVKLDILSQAYFEVRRDMWSILAARVGEKWTLIEQKCMENGLKNLTQASRSAWRKQANLYQEPDSGVGMSDYENSSRNSYTGSRPSILEPGSVTSIQSMMTIARERPSTSSISTAPELPRPLTPKVLSSDTAVERRNIFHDHNREDQMAHLSDESPDKFSTAESSTQQALADCAVQLTDTSRHEIENWKPRRPDAQIENCMLRSAAEDEVQSTYNTQERVTSPQPVLGTPAATPSAPHSSEDEAVDLSEESIDGSSMSCLNDIGAQKEEILNRLMLHFYELFAGTTFAQCTSNNSSSPTSSSKQSVQPPGNTARSTGRKRKSKESSEGDGREDEDRDKPSKRPRGLGDADREESLLERRLACPYYKKHRGRFQPSRACAGPGWLTVHRLKEHLYREHSMPLHCRRCYNTFDTEAQLTDHSRSSNSCVMTDTQPIDGFDKDQERKLKSRRSMFRAESEEHKWKIVYLILFPDTAHTELPSPYYDLNNELSPSHQENISPKAPEFKQFGAYMSRELPRRVRKALEVAMERIIGPIEETLKTEMENIVRNCQEQLTISFMDSIQALTSPPHATPGPSGILPIPQQPRAVDMPGVDTIDKYVSTNEDLSQYFVPPYTTLEPWPELVNVAALGNYPPTQSDSAYLSQPSRLTNSLLNSSWESSGINTHATAHTDILDPSDAIGPKSYPQPYVGKGKGKAVDGIIYIDHGA